MQREPARLLVKEQFTPILIRTILSGHMVDKYKYISYGGHVYVFTLSATPARKLQVTVAHEPSSTLETYVFEPAEVLNITAPLPVNQYSSHCTGM